MTEVLLTRKGYNLVCVDPIGEETIVSIKEGQVVSADIKMRRSYKHLQKYMVLMNEVFENQSIYGSCKKMRKALEIEAGHFDTLRLIDGSEIKIPASVAFDKLDQIGFNQVYERVVQIICTTLIPSLDDKELEQRINDIIGE